MTPLNNEALIDIALHWKEEELICTSCGSITPIQELQSEAIRAKNGLLQYKASCNDCNSFIKWLRTDKLLKIFYKGSMQELAKFDTNLLMWLNKVAFGSKKDNLAILNELKHRLENGERIKTAKSEADVILAEFNFYILQQINDLNLWASLHSSTAHLKKAVREGDFCKQARELELDFLKFIL